jgi:uncharacterized protein (UPF0332 family)
MNHEQLTTLLQYRIQQAYETLHEADILFAQSALRGTVNRSYYAMFYALLALLSTRQLGSSKHSGALSLFDREFVKTGVFSRELSRVLRKAFEYRQTYDYGETVIIDSTIAQNTLNDAKMFITAIETYLCVEGYLSTHQQEQPSPPV